jgi:hypothetical protein
MRRRIEFLTFVLALLFAPVWLLAQDAAPDFKQVGVNAIAALTPVLAVVVLWGLKLAWSKIPASIVLFAAPVVGIGINYAIAWITGHPASDPIVAAALGAVATYLREFASTLASKGLIGSVSVTKGML